MSNSVFLTKEALLSTQDSLAIEQVELLDGSNNVKGHVFVREMTAKEKNTYEMSLTKRLPSLGTGKNKKAEEIVTDMNNYQAKLAICTLCDANGNLLFQMTPANVDALSSKMSASNMERIVDAANRLNKLTPEAQEEEVKNSEAEGIDNSSSASA